MASSQRRKEAPQAKDRIMVQLATLTGKPLFEPKILPPIDLTTLPKHPKDLRPGMMVGHFKLIKRTRPNPNHSSMRKHKWRALCTICNTTYTVPEYYFLRTANPKTSCGCTRSTLRSYYKREYRIWTMMRVRTTNPKHVAYKDYGGRGIKVCDEWFPMSNGFEVFIKYMGPCPSPTHQIDRIENDGNYEPGNVKWSTPKEQRANQRPYTYKSKAHQKYKDLPPKKQQ